MGWTVTGNALTSGPTVEFWRSKSCWVMEGEVEGGLSYGVMSPPSAVPLPLPPPTSTFSSCVCVYVCILHAPVCVCMHVCLYMFVYMCVHACVSVYSQRPESRIRGHSLGIIHSML